MSTLVILSSSLGRINAQEPFYGVPRFLRANSFVAADSEIMNLVNSNSELNLALKSRQSSARMMMMANERVDMVIPPYESYDSSNQEVSYVIDHKRFIEAYPTRCMTSTFLDDPAAVEPSFSLIKPSREIRMNATISIDAIQAAGFEPNKKTVVIIHGFTQSYPETVWLRKTRALFETNAFVGRQNLIIMDYGRASHQSYAQVAAMASGMGSFLANFLMKLFQLGADPMSIHLIGHSLGAHIAGFAGKKLRPKVGRITALDAAGPCFGKILSNPPMDRLGPEDAFEVDAYHYDDDFLGLPGQHGQFDIYVNGGASQPGCSDNMNTMFQALITMVFRRKKVLSESHTRSTEVATVRLTQLSCQQVAYECRDYQAFQMGECAKCDDANGQCFLMGFDYQYAEIGEIPLRTSRPGKKLYISTGHQEPYCLQHYQVLVKFEPSPELAQQAKRSKWRVQMEAIDYEGKRLEPITITNQMAPNVFSYLLLIESPIRVKSARIQVRSSDGKLVQLQQQTSSQTYQLPFKIFNVEINFMSNINPKIRRELSSRLCPVSSSILTTPVRMARQQQELNSVDGPENWSYFEECFEPELKLVVAPK